MLQIVIFLVGVALLCFGAEWLVRGASSLADTLGLHRAVVGLSMVALGTSAPELVVNLLAATRGDVDFALANVSGSNLANLCLGFGLCALIGGLQISRLEFGRDSLVLLGMPLLVWLLFHVSATQALPLWSTIPFTAAILWFFYSLYQRSSESNDNDVVGSRERLGSSVGIFLAGSAALYVGGELVLRSAISCATALNIGKDVIALTVVALGTSVPDITASVIASRRREYEIAIGNILGSNISNIGLVLNGTLLVHFGDLPTTPQVRVDYLAVCIVSAVICGIIFSSGRLTRRTGFALLSLYGGYILFRLVTVPAAPVLSLLL